MDTARHNHEFSGKDRLDGRDLLAMFVSATRLFEHNVENINVLNYFPVPDGDTGTNMHLTLKHTVEEAEKLDSDSAGEVAAAMAKAALFGSRGNSGVILSQFFKGLAVALQGKADFGAEELAAALEKAREHAYKAVPNPVEGTVLTIIDRVAKAARRTVNAGGLVHEVMDAVCEAAREAVALTPSMLPVHRRAGVVDAGGQGMSVILEGVRMYTMGNGVEYGEVPTPTPIITQSVEEVDLEEGQEHERYGYCTNLLIRGEGMDVDAVRERISALGRSPVVVGDDTAVKLHVHTEDPGPVVSYAVSLGRISQVKIDDMDEQSEEFAEARRLDASSEAEEAEAAPVSVVAVAWGRGLEQVFLELGASEIIRAGDTMNPSVQEILDAVESAPSRDVVFLPNNRNILPAAQQTVQLTRKNLKVLTSTTIPQGIAAMIAYNPERTLDENLAEMEETLSSVRTGEVCAAVRAADIGGMAVERGQIIGLLERTLVASGDTPEDVVLSLLREARVSEGQLITLYAGEPVAREEAERTMDRVEAAFPGAEVELVEGGQPHYHYIISIE